MVHKCVQKAVQQNNGRFSFPAVYQGLAGGIQAPCNTTQSFTYM